MAAQNTGQPVRPHLLRALHTLQIDRHCPTPASRPAGVP